MAVIKKGIRIFREMIRKIVFRIKLREMDNMWYYTGASCWQLYPPSFYYTHTEEEIERIKKETIEGLQQMIDEM